jgi:HlyD family secretion protein
MKEVISFAKKHKVISSIFIIIIILIIVSLFLFATSSNAIIATVKQENLVNTVLVNGTYTVAAQTQINSPTNGVITKLYVNNGDIVKKGDPLFHVESSATADQEKAAYADYLSASSTLQSDTADLYTLQSTMYGKWKTYTDIATNSTYQNSNGSPNTTNRVLPEFTTAQDDWLAAEANYKNQKDVIAKDNASLASAKQAYDQTQSVTVTAPATGKIINLADKVNDQVAAPSLQTVSQTDTSQPANLPVLLIADYSNPVIISAVDQANIPRMAVGQKAHIVFDALPDQTYSGAIDHIDAAGIKTQGTTDFNVYITLNNVPAAIRPNMTASITIDTARRNNVLTIPNDAIITKNGKDFVQMAGSDKNNLTRVTLGLKGLTNTEVISGLSVGDKVIEQQ